MLPLMLKMYVGRLGDAGAPLQPRIDSEIANHLGYVEYSLKGVPFLVDDKFSAADTADIPIWMLGLRAFILGPPTSLQFRGAAPTGWQLIDVASRAKKLARSPNSDPTMETPAVCSYIV
jgi:glutathione S-transferase